MRLACRALAVAALGAAAALAATQNALAQVDPAAPPTTAPTNGTIPPLPAATGLLPDAWSHLMRNTTRSWVPCSTTAIAPAIGPDVIAAITGGSLTRSSER